MNVLAAMAGSSQMLALVAMAILFLVLTIFGTVAMIGFYKKVPPGKAMVINKVQRTQVTRIGSLVLPMIWSHGFVHAEAEEVEYDTPDGPKTILLALGDTDEDVVKAHTKFGKKSVEEIKPILKRILENTPDRDADLAKVGYQVVC